jgi:polyisoprenoid-binding protein YceI
MTKRRWNIDTAHSNVHFAVRHMVIAKVRGGFTRWNGTIELDEANPSASKVSARIEAASIDTREAQRDQHLRSADFFDAEKHPLITFDSTKVEKLDGDRYRITGALAIRGVTREVELDTEHLGTGKDPWGSERIAFQAKTTINRKDFGLTWNQALETGGLLVGENVEIGLDVQAVVEEAAERAA